MYTLKDVLQEVEFRQLQVDAAADYLSYRDSHATIRMDWRSIWYASKNFVARGGA